jgi:putative colanic acid biosynthesis UDP-glucose lipid carrier transferase
METHRTIGIRTLVVFWQVLIVTFSYWSWLLIWQTPIAGEGDGFDRYLLYNEFLLIGIFFGMDNRREASGPKKEWVIANRKTVRQTFSAIFFIFLVLFVTKDTWISRSFLISYLPWLYASLFFSNFWLPHLLEHWAQSGSRKERIALAGSVNDLAHIQPWLKRKGLMGLEITGLIATEPTFAGDAPVAILGTMDQAGTILKNESITQLIVLNLSLGSDHVRQLTQLCENMAVRMTALYDLNTYFNHNTVIFDDDGVKFIGLRDEPLESPLSRFLKRILDLVISIPVVFLVLPVTTVLVWLIQRMYSRGPVLFKQQRTGIFGEPFLIYKYRTMHVYNDDQARQAAKNDSRIYPGGKWLRKLSIDELPQFINVLLGEMSVVGPRPHLPAHDEMFSKVMRNYMVRRFIHPGITGWAQVSGYRGEILSEKDIQNRVQADIYYLENWSFSLDCVIILKTIKQCIFPPQTAY